MKKLIAFFKEEDGLELSEYAIMGGLIILVAVAIIGSLGTEINRIFTAIYNQLATVGPAA